MSTLVIEHSDLARLDRFGDVLRDLGYRLRVVRVHRDESLPPDLDDVDAIISLGGPQSPLDDAPWVEPELDLLRRAHAQALPVVGICLGCQLLARAMGGEVARLDGGIMLGWPEVRLTPAGREDPIFAGLPWRMRQLHWNSFHVKKAPPGARVLASVDRMPVAAWALGLRTYAIQFHPETTAETLEKWIEDEPSALVEAKLARDALAAQTRANDAVAARLAQRLFETIALVLMPLDRRYAGVAKDVHH
jgi:GMP synthase (glutamine-hydrolysing)